MPTYFRCPDCKELTGIRSEFVIRKTIFKGRHKQFNCSHCHHNLKKEELEIVKMKMRIQYPNILAFP